MPTTDPNLDRMTPEAAAILLSRKNRAQVEGTSELPPTEPSKENASESFFGVAVDFSTPPSRKGQQERQPLALRGFERLHISHWFERCDLPEEHFAWCVEVPRNILPHFPDRMVLRYAMSVSVLDKFWPFELTVKANLVAAATGQLRMDLHGATLGERPAAAHGPIFLSKDGAVESEWIKF